MLGCTTKYCAIKVLIFLAFSGLAWAQPSTLPPCNCDALGNSELNYFGNAKEAHDLLMKYVGQLQRYSKKRITDSFEVIEANCGVAKAVLCPTRPTETRLILYNNQFLNRLSNKDTRSNWVDKHVLLHELGHHVLGHHKNQKSIEAIEETYRNENPDPKLWKKYGADNPAALEFAADIFGLWALSKVEPQFSIESLIRQFDLDTIRHYQYRQNLKGNKQSYPLFEKRMKVMRDYYAYLTKKSATPVSWEYFGRLAGEAYFTLWPEQPMHDILLSLGTTPFAVPVFSAGGKKVDGFLYPLNESPSYHIGLSWSRFQWRKPWQLDLDLHATRQRYGTTQTINDEEKLVESFQWHSVSLSPRISWNTVTSSTSKLPGKSYIGLLAGLGATLHVPIGRLNYINYAISTSPPRVRPSVYPRVTLGLMTLKKSFLPKGGVRFLCSYSPQWIRLTDTGSPNAFSPVVYSHNLECTLQYTIIRK